MVSSLTPSTELTDMAAFTPRFLVVSLGNQKPYYDTLHSAGHFALASLQKVLAPAQPPFTREKYGKKGCLASTAVPFTLVQSPTLMNVSGPWVAKTWRQMLVDHELTPDQLALVVVHDDLEENFGAVKIRKWTASHRGHNGLKSINNSIKPADFPGARWSRISVGIDRPEGRNQQTVSDYVLGKFTMKQLEIIDQQVGSRVLTCLETLQSAWEQDLAKAAAKVSPKKSPKEAPIDPPEDSSKS